EHAGAGPGHAFEHLASVDAGAVAIGFGLAHGFALPERWWGRARETGHSGDLFPPVQQPVQVKVRGNAVVFVRPTASVGSRTANPLPKEGDWSNKFGLDLVTVAACRAPDWPLGHRTIEEILLAKAADAAHRRHALLPRDESTIASAP